MLRLIIKLLVLRFAGNQLHNFTRSVAHFTESRANTLARSLELEFARLVKSALAISLMLGAAFITSLIAIGWIFAAAWDSPYRDAILGAVFCMPIIFAIIIYVYLRRLWRNQLFLGPSRSLWAADWEAVHRSLNIKAQANVSPQANGISPDNKDE